jgi:hypothetical protein
MQIDNVRRRRAGALEPRPSPPCLADIGEVLADARPMLAGELVVLNSLTWVLSSRH